jgi:PAS domain S-box-containing protein
MDKVNVILGAIERLKSGDLSARTGLPPDSSELDCIGSAFDRMAQALEFRYTERDTVDELIEEPERRYRPLFDEIQEGFALFEIIRDQDGNPHDYRFLAVNPAFARMTGLKSQDVLGCTLREVLPDIEKSWVVAYGKVALTGEPFRFENHSYRLGKHFEVLVFSPQEYQLAAMFMDITERVETQHKIERQLDKLTALREIDLAITKNLDLEITLGVILDKVVSQLGVDASSVLLMEERTQTCFTLVGRVSIRMPSRGRGWAYRKAARGLRLPGGG